MKKALPLLFALMLFPCVLSAQKAKKVIAQAKTCIKNGKAADKHDKALKEFEKAEKSMRQLLQDSANYDNEKIWITLYDAIQAQYDLGNEQLYLKQAYDTTALFNNASKMFDVLVTFDSIDAKVDKNGIPKLKYRKRHGEILDTYRPNLFYGGAFFVNKGDFNKAYTYFDKYIVSAELPILKDYDYLRNDTLIPSAAYWALYSAYRMNQFDMALKYKELALRDDQKTSQTTQYLAEIYRLKGDTAEYVRLLTEGFHNDPEYPFFFPRLIDYYNSREKNDSMMAVVDMALANDSTNKLYRYAKSTVLLNMGKYKECNEICNQLIAEDENYGDAYYNLGLAYFNQAVELDKVAQRSRQKRRAIRELYEKSLPYMEKYRQLEPEQKGRWLPVLYILYLNLNMGEQFDEIDRLRSAAERR